MFVVPYLTYRPEHPQVFTPCQSKAYGSTKTRSLSTHRLLPRRYPSPAVPAFPSAQNAAPRCGARVEDEEVSAATLPAGQATLVFLFVHRYLPLCRSDSLIRWRCGARAESVPGSTAPWTDAATAQPTMPSSQWFSRASGRSFHSSTTRPRPSVRTRYSALRCSARSRCRSGLRPKSDRHPLSPIGTASRAWMKLFQ